MRMLKTITYGHRVGGSLWLNFRSIEPLSIELAYARWVDDGPSGGADGAQKPKARPSVPFSDWQSGLEIFLYAEIGTEVNGQILTVLSLLARIGEDPWEVAKSLAQQPRSLVVDYLAECINKLSGSLSGVIDVNAAATRLALLLRAHADRPKSDSEWHSSGNGTPKWLQVTLSILSFSVLLALQYFH